MIGTFRRWVILLAVAVASASCGGTDLISVQSPETISYAASLGVNLSTMTRLPSGVYYKDLVVGDGARADSGKVLDMRYTGWFNDGTRFDTNVGGVIFTWTLGEDAVVNGWHLGIPGMHVGGKRQLVIPPAQGYGSSNYGDIPGGSVLVFTVDLTAVR